MDSLVDVKCRLLGEFFEADATFVWFFTCVDTHVNIKVWFAGEGALAFSTIKWLINSPIP